MESFRLHSLSFCVLVLLLSACSQSPNCVEQSKTDDNTDPFKKVQVEVGVDGSGSMLGYVSQKATLYSQAIDSLNTLLANKSVPTRYWRIGLPKGAKTNVSALQELSATEFLQARSPAFYDCKVSGSTFPCVTSTLEKVYEIGGENPKQETLRILLTDLEPDQVAVGQLSGKISSELKTHNNYKAVLLGVRSQYDGSIFAADTGENGGRTYRTQDKDVDREGRPFYVLMTGPSAAVDAMIQRFQQLPLDVNQAIRASSFAIAGKDTLVMDKSKIPLQINPCTEQTGAINRQRPKSDQQDQWLLMEQKCETKPLELTIPSQESVILAGNKKLSPESFQVSNDAVEVKDASVNGDQLTLSLMIDSSKFAKKKGQIITITLQKRDLDKATWQGWNTDVKAPDGAKTQNLDLFIAGLRDSVENVVQNADKKQATQEAVKYCLGFTRYD